MLALLLLLKGAAAVAVSFRARDSLPTIDLGYSTVQAYAYNDTLDFYRYANIRFAAPPVGDLRWRPPQSPLQESSVNNGSIGYDCTSNEDCLFLDVYSPPGKQSLPVMVFVYGGGFAAGSKDQNTPEGLFNVTNDFIFVAANYRLGMTSLANGPTLMHNGTANTGLWDVAFAFEWVQQYISLFGGDPTSVTGVGFSAGASQVLFQMTRFAGQAKQLFSRAYIMSPGWVPGAGNYEAEAFWQNVSTVAGCSGGDVGCMRQIDFATLQDAGSSVYAECSYQYQPRIDGNFVASTYEQAFYTGTYNWSGPIVLSHAQHEANGSPVSTVNSSSDLPTYLRTFFPGIADAVVEEVLELYPESDYQSAGLRAADMRQSFDLTAKLLAITRALNNQTWNIEFGISPASHGSDQSYYFYGQSTNAMSGTAGASASSQNMTAGTTSMGSGGPPGMSGAGAAASATNSGAAGPQQATATGSAVGAQASSAGGAGGGMSTSSVNATIAYAMQRYLMSFVLSGDPNAHFSDATVFWPRYQANTTTMLVNTTGFALGADVNHLRLIENNQVEVLQDLNNARSAFWNKVLWY